MCDISWCDLCDVIFRFCDENFLSLLATLRALKNNILDLGAWLLCEWSYDFVCAHICIDPANLPHKSNCQIVVTLGEML